MEKREQLPEEKVIERYSDMVYRLAFSRTGTTQDAEDVYQEVFYRYLKKHPEFESEEHRKAWLIRVTVNRTNSFLTSAWRKRRAELPEDLPFEDRRNQELYRELRQLPGKYREVIHLFYYEELSVEEIAGALGRKPSTVRTQLTRAREMLRRVMKEEDYEF
ncbi:MAG: sigma-70 family RNA polymerase sigma factor [Roseburia sp.]|nr:sigma-70 family RNA polymerase sigma factor [Roseburia sp.]MCM1097496.1 sigma-70 family RNA polymerase sigma factor [Ruminococcus flavefaciens]